MINLNSKITSEISNLSFYSIYVYTYLGAIGGVHILPFFPSSGDRGFAPMRYDVVDEAFGTMEDVKEISNDNYLIYDFMVNHI